MDNWFTVKNIEEIDSPALLVYPERMLVNIRKALSVIGNVDRLRPHVKTVKCGKACQMMMEAGITKFKSATIAEAEMLAQSGSIDVLLAYQPVAAKLQRFCKLVQEYPATSFSCVTDNESMAKEISAALTNRGLHAGIYIDLNVGMNRTGIQPGKAALDLYKICSKLPGIQLKGLHAYDGHIHDADLATRKQKTSEAFVPVMELIQTIDQSGFPHPILVAGGTPTFPIHAAVPDDRECSPGTFIYWDEGYQSQYPDQDFLIAAVLISRVISLPTETLVCTDLGHKSVASENELKKRIHFLNLQNYSLASHSEEHLVLSLEPNHSLNIGDLLYGVPYHICPTVALYEKVYTVYEREVKGEWVVNGRNRSYKF